jgi:hypothetical protein
MARSTSLDEIMRELTPEKLEAMRLRRLANIKAMTMEFQLGLFVGKEITRRHLPSLEVDMIHTRKVIEVDPAEKVECKRLDDIWFEKSQSLGQDGSSKEWQELRAYHEMLEAKYLPKELVCHIQPVNYIDEEQFKLGIVRALWDSDICHYKCSDPSDVGVKLEDNAYFTTITLKR